MNNKSHNDNSQLFREASWMVVYICEAFLILTGNVITIYIFWSIRKRLKRTSYLLINLAVADILVGIALILWLLDGIAAMTGSDINKTVNKTATVVDTLGLMASISSLALISLERMVAILWPFRNRLFNIWHYHVSVGIVWLIAVSNAIITLHFDIFSSYRFVMAVTVIISVLVVTGAYLAIWISIGRNRSPTKTCKSMEQNRKLAKTLLIVTTLSIILCLPTGIGLVFIKYMPHAYSFPVHLIMAAQYANSFLNPVVYSFKMPEFKMSLKKLFCRCPRKRLLFSENSHGDTSGVILRSLKSVEINW